MMAGHTVKKNIEILTLASVYQHNVFIPALFLWSMNP